MTKKHAFIIFAGANEIGRMFHALIYAKQAHARGEAAQVYFAAEGTCWPGLLADTTHQFHSLFEELKQANLIIGACQQCSIGFGNKDITEKVCELVQGPAESYGQIDILGLEDAGWRVWLF